MLFGVFVSKTEGEGILREKLLALHPLIKGNEAIIGFFEKLANKPGLYGLGFDDLQGTLRQAKELKLVNTTSLGIGECRDLIKSFERFVVIIQANPNGEDFTLRNTQQFLADNFGKFKEGQGNYGDVIVQCFADKRMQKENWKIQLLMIR